MLFLLKFLWEEEVDLFFLKKFLEIIWIIEYIDSKYIYN